MMTTMQTIVAVTLLRTASISSVEYLDNNAVLKVDLVGTMADDTRYFTLFIHDEQVHMLVGYHGQSEVVPNDVLGFLPVAVLESIAKFMIHTAIVEENHELEVIADDPQFFIDRQDAFIGGCGMLEAAGVLTGEGEYQEIEEVKLVLGAEEEARLSALEDELFGTN